MANSHSMTTDPMTTNTWSLGKDTWNNFVAAASGGSFLQSWEWGQMQAELGVPYWRLGEEENGVPVSVALVIKRQLPWGQSWLYVPRGPISKASETSKSNPQFAGLAGQLVSLAQREGAVFVRIEPPAVPGRDWQKATNDVQPRHTLIVDITQSGEDLLGAMHQKTRYNIRLAQRKGVKVRFSRRDGDLALFLKLSKEVNQRSAFSYHPDRYYHAMLKLSTVELAVAEYEGEIVAVHILISWGDTVTYVHGASSSTQRSLMAPHLLHWESIKKAKAAGYAKYDFFGVAPPVAPPAAEAMENKPARHHPWDGITKFKEGFGGQRVSYLGAYDYVLDSLWYWTYSTGRHVRNLWR